MGLPHSRRRRKRRKSELTAAFVFFPALVASALLLFSKSTQRDFYFEQTPVVRAVGVNYERNFCKGDRPTNFLGSTNRAWLALLLPVIAFFFVGVAMVTETYFVPALNCICERLKLSEDVAGATFMAAGSSAPELFTSLLSTLGDDANLGVGTIVGSAVFNVCIIIAVSAFFAAGDTSVDFRPLLRDAAFYSVSIIMLLIFVLPVTPGRADWWEGLLMLLAYCGYIAFMKFGNEPYFEWASRFRSKRKESRDPEKANTPCFIAECLGGHLCQHQSTDSETVQPTETDSTGPVSNADGGDDGVEVRVGDLEEIPIDENGYPFEGSEESEELERRFLGVPIPTNTLSRIAFPVLFPWQLLFRWTIFDCAQERWAHLWPQTFIFSILYIVGISFGMVKFSEVAGCYIGIPSAVMGLTLLAAGTSVPDALASISVAKEGKANMAVSNAIGSNIFDIFVALGLPWLIAGIARKQVFITIKPITLVVVPVFILFGVVVLLLVAMVLCKWKLSKTLGIILSAVYLAFVTYALLDVYVFKVGMK